MKIKTKLTLGVGLLFLLILLLAVVSGGSVFNLKRRHQQYPEGQLQQFGLFPENDGSAR